MTYRAFNPRKARQRVKPSPGVAMARAAPDEAVQDAAARLRRLIRPVRIPAWEFDLPWDALEAFLRGLERDFGAVEMEPDFQRSHAWSEDQTRRFIEDALRGVCGPQHMVVCFNQPAQPGDLSAGQVLCLDGLRRMEAVLGFLAGRVLPFGLSVDDLRGTEFSHQSLGLYLRVRMYDFAYRHELLSHYLDLHAGRPQHSWASLDNIRRLQMQAMPDIATS